MFSTIYNSCPNEAKLEKMDNLVKWTNHKDLLLALIAASDECLLVSPFLAADFSQLFSGISLSGKKFELISTCAARGEDQFVKPFSLRSFAQTLKNANGDWPTIGLDQKLHSKVYVFRKNGRPFAGVVTSANLTESGLERNHETGILIQAEDELVKLELLCRSGLDYVNLTEWQIDKLCTAAEIITRSHTFTNNLEIGLKSILNNYATPSAGNRSTVLRSNADYYVKVSGVTDEPILPEHRHPINEPHCILTFSKEPKSISLGDCLLEVAVGGACFLSYYACASAVAEFSDGEKAKNEYHKRWPYYVYANNLSLNYGPTWFEGPLYYNEIVSEFKMKYPSTPITKAGADHFLGAMQRGHSYIEVTKEFGEYVRSRIDAYTSS